MEIADHPDEVVVPPGLPGLLTTLADRLEGRLALVSGRAIAALEAMLGPLDIAMAGSHGGEFRPAGTRTVQPLAAPIARSVIARLRDFAQANGDMLVEPKPYSVAVHYRRHPEALEGLLACAQTLAHSDGLHFKHGKQVIELVMPGSDKGAAVDAFMRLDGFAGARPLFLGDDVTDEDAFRAMAPHGGAGVLVGPPRASAAHWRLPDVASVHAWLHAALDASPSSEGSGKPA
ncbi:trehalose-phosphatase [Novosphingobium sp. 1949]|uniref:Trehalose 6-phosphate phosphatase n=1 Tax=Novosphingobium organovorum TaxID=2930092 RepID=A0ABT0BDQ1_9SPHN|nr:trehalose-phosphatase [Novosphingobium organovorum]MCJ2183113.1 trehalose-phosphatase [Novosphingobium organovorum]